MKSIKYKLLNIASITVSASLVLAVAVFSYMAFWPLDVIKDSTWELSVANKVYRPGDTVVVHVVADKLKPLGGEFIRTIECSNNNSAYVSYHIADSYSNRSSGHVVTDIPVKIPDYIPNLPTNCRIAFEIEYHVYMFRNFSEYNHTNTFKLTNQTTSSPKQSLQSSPSSPAPFNITNLTNNTTTPPPKTSPSGGNASTPPAKTNNQQKAPTNTNTGQDKSNIITRVVNAVKEVL